MTLGLIIQQENQGNEKVHLEHGSGFVFCFFIVDQSQRVVSVYGRFSKLNRSV